jgi:hypothetical protein
MDDLAADLVTAPIAKEIPPAVRRFIVAECLLFVPGEHPGIAIRICWKQRSSVDAAVKEFPGKAEIS